MHSRTHGEALTDQLLMLFLVSECKKLGCKMTGKVKLTKLLYLAQCKMIKDRVKGLNYNFFRWDFGPMSTDLLHDLDCLSKNGLLKQDDNFITVTNKGTGIIKNTTDLLNRNTELVEYIRQVIREFGPYKGKSIKEVVYGLAKVNEKKHIADTKHGEPLLSALSIEQANRRFWLDDEWMETLSILLDKDMCESLDRGIQDAKEGKIEKYVPLKNTTFYSS